MGKTKVVLVGAGSASFGLSSIADFFTLREQFVGSTLTLVDVNPNSLARMGRLADRLNAAVGGLFNVECTGTLSEALPGAEFVLVSVEVDRLECWKLDWEIPHKYGIKHVLGENGGPGGLSHALRTISLVLSIARQIEKYAPNAWLLNMTNPLTRVCLALTRYTRLKTVGLCHQINKGYYLTSYVLGRAPELPTHYPDGRLSEQLKQVIDLKAAGLNHVTWIQELREQGTGRDLYPEFLERLRAFDPSFEPLSRRLLDVFGLFPATGDDHLGEFFSFAHETSSMRGYDFEAWIAGTRAVEDWIERVAHGDDAPDAMLNFVSGERVLHVVAAILNNLNQYEIAVNVVNNGALPGLPDWAVVEVPAVVSSAGITPLRMPPLPPAITALLNQQVAIQDRTVEAAVHGDRQAALQALMLDPLVSSYEAANRMLDELLETHRAYLPEFEPTLTRG